MRLSVERVARGMFVVRDRSFEPGELHSGPLGECLDYIERRFIEDEVGRVEVRLAPRDLFAFAKSGQIGPVTESNP